MITKVARDQWETEEIPRENLNLQFVHQACRRASSEGVPATASFFTETNRDEDTTKVIFIKLSPVDVPCEPELNG